MRLITGEHSLLNISNGRRTNLLMLSRVSSSLNNFANPKISSLETRAPVLTYNNNIVSTDIMISMLHIYGNIKQLYREKHC